MNWERRMEKKKMKTHLIVDWQHKNLSCYFCGETRSVKYKTEVINPIESDKPIQVCVCNKCALRFIGKENIENEKV